MENTYQYSQKSKKSDKSKKTFDKYGTHTTRGMRIKIEKIKYTTIILQK